MPEASVTSRCIGGIAVQVIGLEELARENSRLPVGVLFVLHGRYGMFTHLLGTVSLLKKIQKTRKSHTYTRLPTQRSLKLDPTLPKNERESCLSL